MSKSHNKKRNVGIIYELLLRNISASLIRNDKVSAQNALNIIENRFDKSSELYKEFRLFSALVKSTVSSSAVAAAILTEAKGAARRCDNFALNREKSLLIKDINHKLNDNSFYHRRVPEYKTYATIQTLLNDWRNKDRSNLSRVIQYEARVVEWLLKEKQSIPLEDHKNPDVNSLVVDIMTEKLNKRYGGKLNKEQRNLMQEYVFSLTGGENKNILERLEKTKNTILKDLSVFKTKTDNDVILNKIDHVHDKLINESFKEINDDSISRFLVLIQLRKELQEALNV
jgi:hypothetical protein